MFVLGLTRRPAGEAGVHDARAHDARAHDAGADEVEPPEAAAGTGPTPRPNGGHWIAVT
jgi:hypothetical protein